MQTRLGRPEINSWRTSLDNFDENTKSQLTKPETLNKENLTQCVDLNKKIIDRVRLMSQAAEEESKQLDQSKSNPASRPIYKMIALSLIANSLIAAGAITSDIDQEEPWVGGGVQIAGGVLSVISLVYNTYLDVQAAKRETLQRLINRSHAAELLQKFLSELKILLDLNKQARTDRSPSSNSSFNLEDSKRNDVNIEKVLHRFEYLPTSYRTPDIYSGLISRIIACLPPEDELHKEFVTLFSVEANQSQDAGIDHPLHIDSADDISKPNNWTAEEAASFCREPSSISVRENIPFLERYRKCQTIANQRFHCNSEFIVFFEFNGERVNEAGLIPPPILVSSDSSSQNTVQRNHSVAEHEPLS